MVVALTTSVALSGCSVVFNDPSTSPQTATTEPGTTIPSTTVLPPGEYPSPPATVTNQTATEVALEYELALISNTFQNESYENFSVGIDDPDAMVLNQSDGGVYVQTHIVYRWNVTGYGVQERCDETATYFVNPTAIRRLGGTDVTLHKALCD